jgi:hypothetical protein
MIDYLMDWLRAFKEERNRRKELVAIAFLKARGRCYHIWKYREDGCSIFLECEECGVRTVGIPMPDGYAECMQQINRRDGVR